MTGLLAIDRERNYLPALRLAGRLAFEGMNWHAAHVQSPFTPIGMPLTPFDELGDAITNDQLDAERVLERITDEACFYNMAPQLHLMDGPIASSVMAIADQIHADLVVLGSRHTTAMSAMLLGSLGRALAIGARQSLLIGRGNVAETGEVSAVFATDHSYYAEKALDHLIGMRPKGLKKITLVTAYDPKELSDAAYFGELTKEAKAQGLCLKDKLKILAEASVRKLRSAGYVAYSDMKPGTARDALKHAMVEHSADLLILGAQGHGFFERVLLGSTALQQVVSEPHSLMIVRP